ncbi:family 43 glycosylhydrolase [Enterococcus casseliflavus]|uniref:family 43 glycosylhydrolase n=1 Tax=Enterococcus casseliflavus TaxID=37734 RepID=UPI0035DECB52
MTAYLFCHFTGEQKNGEQVYFSVSKDGLTFTDLNQGHPVLKSDLGEKGVRDPFLVKGKDTYYLIATDLRIEKGLGWAKAQTNGSRQMVIWSSTDLVYWTNPWTATIAPEDAGNLWAPEAIYDAEKETFFVYFAANVNGKHKIYSVSTKDFQTFTEPVLFIEKTMDVIDTTIVYSQGYYYRFTKNEENSRIFLDRSQQLTGDYQEVTSEYLAQLEGVEGPQLYQLPDGKWALIVDHFKKGTGYGIAVSDDLATGVFEPVSAFDFGQSIKRHGGVITITDDEYQRLLTYYQQKNPVLDGLYADPDLVSFNGKFYLYPTSDGFTDWSGTSFSVFESEDLTQWTNKGTILDLASSQVKWTIGGAWAPCTAEKEGTFYFYFTGKMADGRSGIGVAYADHPTGPFIADERPLLSSDLIDDYGLNMSQVIDPSVYVEAGKYYLLFGNSAGGTAAIVALGDDMRTVKLDTLAEYQGLEDFREAITVLKKDDLYHFTWSGEDTRSEDYHVNYGTSSSLYGPIHYHYPVLQKNVEKGILGTGHHSILEYSDRYYIAYHSFAVPLSKYPEEARGFHRQVRISPLDFDEAGYMKQVIV